EARAVGKGQRNGSPPELHSPQREALAHVVLLPRLARIAFGAPSRQLHHRTYRVARHSPLTVAANHDPERHELAERPCGAHDQLEVDLGLRAVQSDRMPTRPDARQVEAPAFAG